MGLLDDEELLRKPAFGFFPQMQPRRRFQDPVGAANVPLDVTRGRVAGLLGLLPDVLNFMGRSPMPTEMFGETQYKPAQQMPYGSEYFLQNLPLKPTSRIGEVAGQAGAFVPLNPMPAARAVAAGARALGPTAVGMGERYLQRQGLMPAVVPETPGLLGSIEKPQAPVSELGFYSATEQAALNLSRKSGTGESYLNDLMKGQDVKKDELSWMGLDDYLKGKPNVTRQEVQDFISNNRVDVRERQLSGRGEKFGVFSEFNPDKNQFMVYGEDLSHTHAFNTAEEADAFVKQFNSQIPYGPSKYDKYQLPGGENYREILLTLPEKAPAMYPNFETYFKAQYSDYADLSNPAYAMAQRDAKRNWDATGGKIAIDDFSGNKVGLSTGNYTSSHFKEPNILAHMRVNDRVDADGKKMLLIEEIQSDWHQAGREKGYQNKSGLSQEQIGEKKDEIFNRFDAGEITREQRNAELDSLGVEMEKLQGVPDAPFKDTWHQLALKRALKYAADNGYDRVGLTTGRQQAERYDLSKQISKIYYSPPDSKQANKFGTVFKAFDSRGHEIINKAVTPEELPGIVGKEVAKKLLDAKGNEMGVKALDGIDLQVGGEGMKKYYDEIYPAFLAKQGKKYNAKTGETIINSGKVQSKDELAAQVYGRGMTYRNLPSEQKRKIDEMGFGKGAQSIRYIDISPEMRGGVKKGQPLFTAAPIGGIGLGAGTQDNEMPDAVRQYMANPTLGLLQDEEERKKLGGLLFR